jgi:hypothetical protein
MGQILLQLGQAQRIMCPAGADFAFRSNRARRYPAGDRAGYVYRHLLRLEGQGLHYRPAAGRLLINANGTYRSIFLFAPIFIDAGPDLDPA